MFFSTELLSKRDSGFGLLWLAATLGSKSAFKKLPKRSVLTADISQLCDLIASPSEPLALRLSSNLMVGAARVYKVKQEIFLSDVTTCFNSLKRVVQEFRSMAASEAQLQMAQPSVRPSAVTLAADPSAAFAMDFDAMVADWDEYLNIGNNKVAEGGSSDDEYNPKAKRPKGKGKQSAVAPASTAENARANAHTLNENHDIFLANSFDASFGGSGANIIPSSQNENFGFDDSFFGAFDGLDIGEGVGDDVVRELGEGWGAALENQIDHDMQVDEPIDFGFNDADNLYFEQDVPIDHVGALEQNILPLPPSAFATPQGTQQNSAAALPPSSSLTGHSLESPSGTLAVIAPQAEEIEPVAPDDHPAETVPKKTKRARLILDVRTELTDDELKAARLHYLEEQNAIHRQLARRNFEKDQGRVMDDLLWGVPEHMQAKELVDFWLDHLKAQLDARSAFMIEPQDDSPPSKRRKIKINAEVSSGVGQSKVRLESPTLGVGQASLDYMNLDVGEVDFDMNFDMGDGWGGANDPGPELDKLRSSEEPGQARRASRPMSVLGDNFGLDVVQNSFSQRSALFPWDNAGGSSSASGVVPLGRQSSDKISVDHAETRLRGSSLSRRGSSLVSQQGDVFGGTHAIVNGSPQINDDDFVFDVPAGNSMVESQLSEVNLATLERTSFNFLEYARMQYRSLSGSAQFLAFDDVVPQTTSTAHVAAAALYHCLVLGTKDLIRLRQEEAYATIEIRIK
ncbi:Rec8 like protein-domain-containing protein [Suillus paluster]|uniref:Rec8 like protein-domain-containing protein n=1 Tax=Suillus paluster TaxID=48578 RepID=UPI001B86F527|nr:Rec8 like protein-domain-containing protein [Suillus paluster]KAG1749976.1 Rec8 like protein-domain-containing protein [Suillus paluster]